MPPMLCSTIMRSPAATLFSAFRSSLNSPPLGFSCGRYNLRHSYNLSNPKNAKYTRLRTRLGIGSTCCTHSRHATAGRGHPCGVAAIRCHKAASNGDFIADTPPQQNDFGQSNCSLTDHYCSDGEPEDLSSFMGYAFSCQNKFTQGQREWMFHCLLNFRPFIWSAGNLRCTGVGAQANVVITQQTDWNFTTVPTGFVTITNELRIKNGGILNIAPGIIVQFCDAAKAIVEPGGNLQLFGTLTSACQGKMWRGVEVQGTPASNLVRQPARTVQGTPQFDGVKRRNRG